MNDIIDQLRDYSPYNLDHVVHHGANEIKRLRARVAELEAKLSYMIQWIEVNQPDAFKRGLWDAIADGDKGEV